MPDLAKEIRRLRDAPLEELVAAYERLYGEEPRLRRRTHLWRRVSWKLQADAYGGLSEETLERLDALAADPVPLLGRAAQQPPPEAAPKHLPEGLTAGAELVREWRGREVRVRVVEGGFEHDGVVYASLSAVARAVTGARWNGKLFFGLTARKRGGKAP